jgi:hypothetical protein
VDPRGHLPGIFHEALGVPISRDCCDCQSVMLAKRILSRCQDSLDDGRRKMVIYCSVLRLPVGETEFDRTDCVLPGGVHHTQTGISELTGVSESKREVRRIEAEPTATEAGDAGQVTKRRVGCPGPRPGLRSLRRCLVVRRGSIVTGSDSCPEGVSQSIDRLSTTGNERSSATR